MMGFRETFFFFKQKTAYEMCGRDWSSDVCSSDLGCERAIDIDNTFCFPYHFLFACQLVL